MSQVSEARNYNFEKKSKADWKQSASDSLKNANFESKIFKKNTNGFLLEGMYFDEQLESNLYFETNENFDFSNCFNVFKSNLSSVEFNLVENKHFDLYQYSNQGLNDVEELVLALFCLDFLITNSESSENLQNRFNNSIFSFCISSNFFNQIAKLRAFRILSLGILADYQDSNKLILNPIIHAKTASYTLSSIDTYTNLLRLTTQTLSAFLGGANVITVLAYNNQLTENKDFANELSENIKHLIKHESNVFQGYDHANGSYYIENLSENLCKHSLDKFKDLKSKNITLFDYIAENGILQSTIAESQKQRLANIASRKETFIGVNKYPNTLENTNLAEFVSDSNFKLSSEFEKLKSFAQTIKSNKNQNLTVNFALFGEFLDYKTRFDYVSDIIKLADIDIESNGPFELIDDAITLYNLTKPKVLIICSSDINYTSTLPSFVQEIKNTNPDIYLVLAGKPENEFQRYQELGIDLFISVNSNLIEVLNTILSKFEN